MTSATPVIVTMHDVTIAYDGHPAVHHMRGAIPRGAMLAVVGPNGSGKTTLLKGIAGLLQPIEGRIELTGVDRRTIAYLPQQANIDRKFPLSVVELVSLGLWRETGAFAAISAAGRERVARALSAVGLEGFERRPIGSLSGGQLRRSLFARVLVQDSPLILLDEPFAAIDAKTAADLMGVIERWHDECRTVIAVLHDLELAKERFPDAVLMSREVIAWGRAREVITPRNLLDARTMAERWDDHAPWCEGLRA
jgi:zinc/manganese transport system ATP-binding protein